MCMHKLPADLVLSLLPHCLRPHVWQKAGCCRSCVSKLSVQRSETNLLRDLWPAMLRQTELPSCPPAARKLSPGSGQACTSGSWHSSSARQTDAQKSNGASNS